MMQLVRFGIIGVLVGSWAPRAFAQTAEERAGARAAAEQGVKAYNDGRWADTVNLMTRAEKLVHAPTHLLYLAQAEEKLGHFVIAQETYLGIVRERLAADAPEAFVVAQLEAKKRSESLRGRLSQITVVVRGAAAGAPVTVLMDQKRIPDALVDLPHPVDPGEHQFEAIAEGMRSNVAKVTLREGTAETLELTLAPTARPSVNAQQPSAEPTKPTSDSKTAAPVSTDRVVSGTHPLKIGGYVGIGVGVIGVGLGTVFTLRSSSLATDADALCQTTTGNCPAANRSRIEELDDDSSKARNLGIAGFVAGGVGLATGITMLLIAPSSTPKQSGSFAAPYFAGNSAGVWGRF